MTIGFARNDDLLQAKCPCCGRFPSEETGFYAWVEHDPDSISLFCDRGCALKYQAKGGVLVDGDGVRYRLAA